MLEFNGYELKCVIMSWNCSNLLGLIWFFCICPASPCSAPLFCLLYHFLYFPVQAWLGGPPLIDVTWNWAGLAGLVCLNSPSLVQSTSLFFWVSFGRFLLGFDYVLSSWNLVNAITRGLYPYDLVFFPLVCFFIFYFILANLFLVLV